MGNLVYDLGDAQVYMYPDMLGIQKEQYLLYFFNYTMRWVGLTLFQQPEIIWIMHKTQWGAIKFLFAQTYCPHKKLVKILLAMVGKARRSLFHWFFFQELS